jgi:hypothetical protein
MECIKPIGIRHKWEAYNLQLHKQNRPKNIQPRFFFLSQKHLQSHHHQFILPIKNSSASYTLLPDSLFPFEHHQNIRKIFCSYALCNLDKHQHLSASSLTMETDDSDMEKFFTLLKQQKAQLKKAQVYKGQKPPASMKRPRSVLQQEFYIMVWWPFGLPFFGNNTDLC